MAIAKASWLDTAAAARIAGQPEAAATAYLRVLELDPTDSSSSLRGLYYLQVGEPLRRALVQQLRQLIEAAAPHPLAYCLLGHWLR